MDGELIERIRYVVSKLKLLISFLNYGWFW